MLQARHVIGDDCLEGGNHILDGGFAPFKRFDAFVFHVFEEFLDEGVNVTRDFLLCFHSSYWNVE